MFKLLSKESNIFSIPVYIGFLLLIVITFNILNFNALDAISAIVTFAGIALGYFCFNAIGLTYQTHVPLFLYTFFIFAFYPGNLDIGLSTALFTNSFLILALTSTDANFQKKSYVLVGAIIALNYIFLPATWPMGLFVILHVLSTSERISLHIFRLFFGVLLIVMSYFSIMYFMNFKSWNEDYFPFTHLQPNENFHQLIYLIPVVLLLIAAVFDHFQNYNKKSPVSRFKYTFLLIFALAQLITIILYMGNRHEFLMLLALPASIILSRVLRFAKKYWQKELGLWIVIASLITFKITGYF